MLKCNSCKKKFEDYEIITVNELDVCPACKDTDYYTIAECRICGEGIEEYEIYGDEMCEDCFTMNYE